MTGDVRGDLRRLPWWLAIALALLAIAVLALRAVGLVVAVVVTTAERIDAAAATAAGIAPLGASTWLLTDLPVPGWTPRGDDQ